MMSLTETYANSIELIRGLFSLTSPQDTRLLTTSAHTQLIYGHHRTYNVITSNNGNTCTAYLIGYEHPPNNQGTVVLAVKNHPDVGSDDLVAQTKSALVELYGVLVEKTRAATCEFQEVVACLMG